jgi:NAD(P)-dependent dehydrogenase (short-subunit alcohol dehydrogenase family)
VVTGAASGIGAATCEVLAAAGAAVVCGDVNAEGLDATVKRVADVGGRAVAVVTDVTVRADVERLVGTAVSELGRIDAMCNIAGAMFPGLVEDLDDETIDRGIDLNLKGVLYGTQYAVRAMKPNGSGSIVNVSSAAIDKPYVGIGVYAFTKAAVAMLTMTTALEVGEHGIRVNAIAPGYVETDINRDFFASDPGKALVARIPQRRLGRPGDLDGALLLLASDASAYMTGSAVVVDGGHLQSTL